MPTRHGDTLQGLAPSRGLVLIGLSPNLDIPPPNLISIEPTGQREGLGLFPHKSLPQAATARCRNIFLATSPHVFIDKDGFFKIMLSQQ